MKRLILILALVLAAPLLSAQSSSGIINPSRSINWSNAGVVGGVPSATWTQCGSTIAAGASAATIQTALNGCAANHFVLLGAGTFNLSTFLAMKSNVVLRGSGADQTHLIFGTGAYGGGCFIVGSPICFTLDGSTFNNSSNSAPGASNAANWTGGFSQGATSITVGTVGSTGIINGQYIYLDQANDTTIGTNLFNCDLTSPLCSIEGGSPGRTISGVNHSQLQVVKVTAGCASLCTGTGPFTLTITPGLYGVNWSSGKAPGAWFATTQITNSGIENLSIDNETGMGDNGSTINFLNANNSWVSGITSIKGGRAHVWIIDSAHITVQNSYFYQTQDAASQSYGTEEDLSSDNLVVNNIMQQVTAPMMGGSQFGDTYAYNFSVNNFQTQSASCMFPTEIAHDAAAEYNLFEGNFTTNVEGDVVHGSNGLNTAYRNVFPGYELGKSCATLAVTLDPYNRNYNIVANVLGTPGKTVTYQNDPGGQFAAYDVGQAHSTIGADPVVGTTLLRWGNYDNVTGAVRWCGNSSNTGWSTTCSSTSEVPTAGVGSPSFANAVPTLGDTGGALPASFVYGSRPPWWPSAKAWPPIGPDVTNGNLGQCSGGTYANLMTPNSTQCTGGTFTAHINGGHANSVPAQDCFANVMNGPPDGSGSVLSFNAANCYANASPPWSTFIDSSRATDWRGHAGFTIPAYTVACATQPTGIVLNNSGSAAANTTAIQNSANSCDATHNVVNLPAGTIYVTSLRFGAQGKVVIRGASSTSTIIIPTTGTSCAGGTADGICMQGPNVVYNGSSQVLPPSGTQQCLWTGGLTQGSTTVTLTSCPAPPTVGQVIDLDQGNDPSDNGGIFICDVNINQCGYEGNGGGNNNGRSGGSLGGVDHSLQWTTRINAVSGSGTGPYTVTLDSPMPFTNIRTGTNAGAWWYDVAQLVGLENFTIDGGPMAAPHPTDFGNIGMYQCYQCWVRNVRSLNAGRHHIDFFMAYQPVVRDNYIFGSAAGGSESYSVEFATASGALVENNILQHVTVPIMFGSGSGNVISYNFSILSSYGAPYVQQAYESHNAGNNMNLFEGNDFLGIASDDAWGSSSQDTYFRNFLYGFQNGYSQNTIPINMRNFNRAYNIVGNVLGTAGWATGYQTISTSTTTFTGGLEAKSIYTIGLATQDSCNASASLTICDPITSTSLSRWGNYDTVNNAVRWVSAEAAPGAIPFVNANFSTSYFNTLAQTLPASLFYTSTPSWWTSGKAWPPIGPDVTTGNLGQCTGGTYALGQATSSSQCTGGTLSSAWASHIVSIPALDCYLNVLHGPPDGTGSALPFSATACYSAAPPPTLSSITVLPNPATVTTTTTVSMQTGSPITSTFCTFSDASVIAAGAAGCIVTWTDTNAHSSINSAGLVTGVSVGSDTVTATISAVSGSATVNVTAAGPAIIQKKFIDCHLGCTNQIITPTTPTTPGHLLVIAETSSVPITNIQGGGVWSPLYSGMITNSDVVQWVSMAFMLNAPAMSTITVKQTSWTGAIEFYELGGVNAVDTACIKQLSTPLATTTSKSVSCTSAHVQEILIGALAGAPNTPTVSGSLAVDSTLALNNSIFASAVESSSATYSFGGTWASGSGRPTITMAGFYQNSLPTAVKPILSPGTGNYGASQSVAMKTPTVGGVIHYAINATPTCASTTYTAPVAVTVSETLAAITCGAAGYNNSAVTTNVYGITGRTTPITWYVRQDGAGLYTTARATTGGSSGPFTGSAIGCDGQADVSYAAAGGTGTQTNLHCAVSDFRYLFDPQTFNNSNPNTWTPQGGDTILIRGCATNADQSGNTTAPQCRMGYDNNTGPGHGSTWCFGGGVNGCANPPIPSGSPSQHTRILGQNFAACGSQGAMTYLFGGFGLGAVLDLSGAQYVDVECLNITRNGNCIQHGTPAVPSNCGTPSSPVNDYASDGFHGTTATHDVLIQDAWVHGFPDRGWKGPIGGLVDCERCNFDTNGEAGWDFDDGSGSSPDVFGGFTGVGTASVNGDWRFNFSIMQWSGCNQEYPFVHAIPVVSCYSQNNAGYGDGVGGPPGQSVAATVIGSWFLYNVQDAIDLGHDDAGPSGAGYSDQTTAPYLVQDAYAYGNSGATWKAGPNTNPVKILNTSAIGNCSVLSSTITGTNPTYNANLGDFCRSGSLLSLNYHSLGTMTISNNTFITYFGTAFLIQAWEGPFADPGTTLNFQNNIIYGLQNAVPNSTFPSGQDYGTNNGGIGGFFFNTGLNPAEAIATNNRTNNQWFGVRNITCTFPGEICSDPLFVNEWPPCLVSGGAGCTFTEQTWTILRLTAIGGPSTPSFNLTNVSPAINAGVSYSDLLPTDFNGNTQTSPPTDGAVVFLSGPATVATPTASPAAGPYTSPQNVTLLTATAGATICFTTDGSTPTAVTAGTCSHGTTYVGPINVAVTTTISAIGTKAGDINSAMATFLFTINTPNLFNVYTNGNSYKGGRVVFK